jgi:hypothetical protein
MPITTLQTYEKVEKIEKAIEALYDKLKLFKEKLPPEFRPYEHPLLIIQQSMDRAVDKFKNTKKPLQ